MTNTKLVSIIIPCLNGAATLAHTIASCVHQGPVEIILADNGSDDDSIAVAEAAAHGHGLDLRVVSEPEPGVNRARRAGFEAARGDFIQLLDADDILAPGKIPSQVSALEQNRRVDIGFGDWIWVEHGNGPWTPQELALLPLTHHSAAYGNRRWTARAGSPDLAECRFTLAPDDDFLTRLLEDRWLPPHAYLVRRDGARRLHEANAFLPQRQYASDREYFTIAALLGMRFVYVPGSGVEYHGWSDRQMTRRCSEQERSQSLAAIYHRLLEMASNPRAVELSPDQRFLLELDWRPYRSTERNAVEVDTDDADTRMVAMVVRKLDRSWMLEHFAKAIAFAVPRMWERHTAILRLLHHLVADGRLAPVTGDQ